MQQCIINGINRQWKILTEWKNFSAAVFKNLSEGEKATGGALEIQARLVADNVKAIKFPGTGHWLMEEKPVETAAALKSFFGN